VNHPEVRDEFTLVRNENEWKIEEAPALIVDGEKVDKFIDDLKNLRALDFQSERPDAAALKTYQLVPPTVTVGFEFEKQEPAVEPWKMEIGSPKDSVYYGKSSGIDAVFKISEFDAEKLRRNRNYFRDGKLPFKLAVEQVSEIRVKSGANKWTFKKDGTAWKLADPGSQVPDTGNLEKLVQSLAKLEVKEYLGQQAAKGGGQQLEFRDPNGKALLNLSFGEEFTPKSGINKNVPLVYTKSSLVPETLAIAVADKQEIPFENLVKVSPDEGAKPQQSQQR